MKVRAALLFVLAATGCGGGFRHPPALRVYSEGVTIEAVDKSFRLAGNTPTTPPFASDCGGNERMTKAFAYQPSEKLLGLHRNALEKGARHVFVHVPGSEQPLHGILALCMVPKKATQPGARMYSITVPPEQIEAVRRGETIVLHERYTFPYANIKVTSNPWVLWLSSEPLE